MSRVLEVRADGVEVLDQQDGSRRMPAPEVAAASVPRRRVHANQAASAAVAGLTAGAGGSVK
jgi:hypothetical protein